MLVSLEREQGEGANEGGGGKLPKTSQKALEDFAFKIESFC